MENKPRIAVHKFSSCDGCQLAFLNSGEVLLKLAELADIVHFAEAGPLDEEATVDIAFVEGSVSTPHELERIQKIRENSQYVITIGACATSGGLQALRNFANTGEWMADVYATPEYVAHLETATPISAHVKVDLELWGCPIEADQLFYAIRTLLFGVNPTLSYESVCIECKRQGNVCVLVTQGMPCLGPVTKTGCGAICPHVNRACYGCFGPSENPNTKSLGECFKGFDLTNREIVQRFWMINSGAESFKEAGEYFRKSDEGSHE
jgi:sulfhydrogenase subunit delta